ncbi:MAG: hypothetical protein OXG17_04810 [Chloroflexi bacterium]|nr:hypothetical protein [Chloroflexota bacterium]
MGSPSNFEVEISVAKHCVDGAMHRTRVIWQVSATLGELRQLQAQLQVLRRTRILLEATGGYERNSWPP